jgi:hypothetical protein
MLASGIERLSTFTGRYSGDDIGAILNHLRGMEGTFSARNPRNDKSCIFVY